MTEKLLNCPFCGSPAELERDSDHHGQWFNLGCSRHWGKGHDDKCVAGRLWYTETDTPEADAITAWNTRPRTEGRGEGEPVAWRSRPNGYHPSWLYSADKRRVEDWRKGGQVVEPLYASPIREPEISREDYRAQILSAVIGVLDQWHDGLRERKAVEIADAILNLAPVGGRGEEGSSQSQPGVSAVQQSASSSAQHSAEWRCRRCGRDEVDCRENGCPRGPCPMEFVG